MKIAVVVPRYGIEVVGGAESQARGFAEAAVRQGWKVEVWTTCAHSHYTWKNAYPAGVEKHKGVVIRRFPITSWHPDLQAELNNRLTQQGRLSLVEQYTWLRSGAHSIPLYQHVLRYANNFDVIVALPYTAPLVHYAAWIVPDKVVIFPCLHDEPYAYMELVHLLMESIWGCMFFSPEEKYLAIQRLKIHCVHLGLLGGGLNCDFTTPQSVDCDPTQLLYVGRLEEGKNLAFLYNCVQRYVKEGGNIRLTILGAGPFRPLEQPFFENMGFVSEKEKMETFASALALCQPSLNESFSITIMESWLAGRPVLVHGDCAVTRGHVRRSQGGLWFQTYEEFVQVVEWLRDYPLLASRMGQNGRQYVRDNYTWEVVIKRFERMVQQWGNENG